MYVKGLVEELSNLGVKNVIAAPAAGISDTGYRISEGDSRLKVWRFKCNEKPGDLGEIYGEGDPVAAESFKKVLDAERPDIVHFHAWSPAVSILLVREVNRRGLRLVQTYHTPTLSCPRGTLMRWGKIVCDGDLARRPCALCAIHGQLRKGDWRSEMGYGKDSGGVSRKNPPNPESQIRNAQSPTLQSLVSKLTTMFRMPRLIQKRAEAVREMFRTVDAMVAQNDWSRKLLVLNGVAEPKIRLFRHGIPDSGFRIPDSGGQKDLGYKKVEQKAKGALRLVFLGRVAPEKGIDVLLRALSLVKTKVELDIYGIRAEGDSGDRMEDRGRVQAGGGRREAGGSRKPELRNPESRIRWLAPVKPEEVVETIRKYDALVVPSVWLETGPLVVLEAFAAGVPVIGSRLGGIAEMVKEEQDGLLCRAGDPSDLASMINKYSAKQSLIKKNVKKPKSLSSLAKEHLELYNQLS